MPGEDQTQPALDSQLPKLLALLVPIGIGSILIAALIGFVRQAPAQAAGLPAASVSSALETDNLLVNPDFEAGYSYPLPCCNNIAVPVGWNIRWYTDTPSSGYTDYKFKQPEVKIIDATVWPFCCQLLLPPRIHTGRYAIESFTLFANQDTSFYQQVGGIPIGAVVTGSAWAHVWVSSCDVTASITPVVSLQGPTKDGCPDHYWPIESSRVLVGIDPYGGTNPRAATVVWNWNAANPAWWGPYDTYSSTLPVVVTAQAHTVTFFLRGVTTTPAKHDNIYFDTARLTYNFPLSASAQQGRPWPLPAPVTITAQSPVSLTQAVATLADPNGQSIPLTFLGASGSSPAITSRWRFNPVSAGRYVFTLAAYELAEPLSLSIDVEGLPVEIYQDRLLPPPGVPITEPALITITLRSPISLTGAAAVVTDSLGAQPSVTFVSANFTSPDYVFQWRFAPAQAGRHALNLNANEFTQPLLQSIMAAATRVYLPLVWRNAAAP
ncbi:MAG TPA: hypothetical protein VJG32_19790 [Anaerolineae bacterium]|nr:hypothetical protein [Anaerolineae bacterium]